MRLIDADALLEQYDLKDATKYGNKNEEQQANSYSTLMLYEIADMIEDAPTAYDVDKVVEELELHSFEFGTDTLPAHYVRLNEAIEIVKQEAEQYNNGWIPCSEPPENDRYVLLSFENFSVPMVGRYEEDENGGSYYIGDDMESCLTQDILVNAWMNLPAPYHPKGE